MKDGICAITLSSWDEFRQNVLSLKSKRGYVWRGQKRDEDNGWLFRSSFDREDKSKNQHDRNKRLKLHLEKFKKDMNRSNPNSLPEDDVSVWALGQHYGLKSPFLDWTQSPYIAAYFAFSEEKKPGDKNDLYRYVYALNRSLERLISKEKKACAILSSERSVSFIDHLLDPNPRFTAQKGIFTNAFRGKSINQYVEIFLGKRQDEVLIVKFMIPTKERKKCLDELHSMDIDDTNLSLDDTSLSLDLRDVVNKSNDDLKKHDGS